MSAHHKSNNPTLRSLSKRQWMRIAAAAAGVGLVVTGGLATRSIYADAKPEAAPQPTAYSVSDSHAASRGNAREALDGEATYVNVSINGKTRTVLGTNFTDVKSVLDAGDITLESGDKVISSNTFTSYVKKAPVEKVILVGTGVQQAAPTQQEQPSTTQKTDGNASSNNNAAASPSIGTTVPVGDMQQWAHDYLLANGGTEADFTATVYIISHESGWSVTATNASSGAYGLAQALPGSKMASHGADWATNYQTQLKWFWDYCKGRYGSIQGAYTFWQANHWY